MSLSSSFFYIEISETIKLSNTNNPIAQLNIFKYCYVSLTSQLNMGHLFTHS